MISLTLATAFAVRVMGATFLVTSGTTWGTVVFTVVVAIRISLALKLPDYSRFFRGCFRHSVSNRLPEGRALPKKSTVNSAYRIPVCLDAAIDRAVAFDIARAD